MTRRHLLDAARIVFSERGFHGASIDEVAARAGFTKGAVYSNFTSKDDLFLAVLDDHLDQQMAAIQAELEGGPRPMDEEVPRMRDLILESLWGDDWGGALFLEYLLYRARTPRCRRSSWRGTVGPAPPCSDSSRRSTRGLGAPPVMATDAMAVISLALFEGLTQLRLIDPSAVTDEILDQAIEFMYAATYPGGSPS